MGSLFAELLVASNIHHHMPEFVGKVEALPLALNAATDHDDGHRLAARAGLAGASIEDASGAASDTFDLGRHLVALFELGAVVALTMPSGQEPTS